jgi:hypothetical protein
MNYEELSALIAQHAINAEKDRNDFNRRMDRLEESQAKTDAQLARTDAQLAKTIKKLDNIGVMVGRYGLIQGEMTEEMVYRGLQKLFGNIGKNFDEIAQNLKKQGQAEFDIVAVNGTEVLVTEVKTKVRKDDIDDFTEKKLPLFKTFFPKYTDYKILGAIGGTVFREDLSRYAEKKGLYVIHQAGENIKIGNTQGFTGKVFA